MTNGDIEAPTRASERRSPLAFPWKPSIWHRARAFLLTESLQTGGASPWEYLRPRRPCVVTILDLFSLYESVHFLAVAADTVRLAVHTSLHESPMKLVQQLWTMWLTAPHLSLCRPLKWLCRPAAGCGRFCCRAVSHCAANALRARLLGIHSVHCLLPARLAGARLCMLTSTIRHSHSCCDAHASMHVSA